MERLRAIGPTYTASVCDFHLDSHLVGGTYEWLGGANLRSASDTVKVYLTKGNLAEV